MRTKRTRKPTEPTWYWVEGLRKLSGVKVWFPLYCSKTEAGAQLIQRMCEKQEQGYREFRTVPDTEQGIRCSECTSNYLKRIKREGERLWKCLNCGHTWPRAVQTFTKLVHESTGDTPTRLSEPAKRVSKGDEAPRRRAKRQKKPQRPVSTGKKRRKIR